MSYCHTSLLKQCNQQIVWFCCFLGISSFGAAILNHQSSVASITVEASNNPHGIFSFASSSLDLEVTEDQTRERFLVVDRKFGSIGTFSSSLWCFMTCIICTRAHSDCNCWEKWHHVIIHPIQAHMLVYQHRGHNFEQIRFDWLYQD